MGHSALTLRWVEDLIGRGEIRLPGASVLELGPQDVVRYMPESDDERAMVQGCSTARDWYALKGFGAYASLDLNDERATWRLDLNEPLALPLHHAEGGQVDPFDVIYDGGFAEHVFDVAEVFRTCHRMCADGGLMLHALPTTGGLDHGFWSVHPCLYRDLAAANGYEVVSLEVHENVHAATYDLLGQPNDERHVPMGMALAALRKARVGAPFRVPQQGAPA